MILLNTKLSLALLAKRPVVTGIKIIGLTIGVAIATLLMIYADQEFSYDKHFKNSDRVYRSLTIWSEGGASTGSYSPICLRTIYEEAVEQIPEVEAVVQIYRGGNPDIRIGEEIYSYKDLLYADPEYLEVFAPEVLAGDVKRALSSPGMMLITDRLAETLFGSENPIGQTLEVNEKQYSVEAVIKELPYQTHFHFDMLAAMVDVSYLHQLGGLEFFTYWLFRENADLSAAIEKSKDLYLSLLDDRFGGRDLELGVEMEPLTKIHLFTKAAYDLSPNGDVTIIVSLSLLALLILILALVNYINLYLVHSENRSLEIGIRRANGSGKWRLVQLFFAESLVLTTIAFLFGLILLHSTSEWIQATFTLGLDPAIWSSLGFYVKILLLMLFTALMAGLYPALYLSKINPVRALYPSAQGGSRKSRLTRLAVVFQFSVTVFLLTGIGFLNKQMAYVRDLPLGFESEQVWVAGNLNSGLIQSQEAIRSELAAIPHVQAVGASQGTPASGKSGQFLYKEGQAREEGISMNEERVQPGYFEALGIELAAGRVFRDGSPYDHSCIILNETAVKKLGLENPVGSRVIMFTEPMEVIGVVKDFHYASLKNEIGPLAFTFYSKHIFNFLIKAEPGHLSAVKEGVLQTLARFDPTQPITVRSLDEQLKYRYRADYQLSKILVAGSVLAIVLSVMGLFALSLFTIHDRTKEIGVRKVLGARISQVTGTLTWSLIKYTLIAIPIGTIPAYWLMNGWINNFVYKTELSWWMFIPAGITAVIIALLTISIQIGIVARKSPVKSLRYE